MHIAIHNNVAYDVLPMTCRAAVTAEVASSRLVVPTILSKRLAMVLTKPSRTQKGTFQCPFLCQFSVRALLAMPISSRCNVT
jgi:hypothetical protein